MSQRYKERLKIKYLCDKSNVYKKSFSRERILDAKQWTFVKDGLDDFRDGLPPPHNNLLIKNQKGPLPTLINQGANNEWKFKESVLPASCRLTKQQRIYSKKLPLAQARQSNIEEIVEKISKHPLAIHAHYSESMPNEVC